MMAWNSPISSILNLSPSLSWNFHFRHNLIDSKSGDFKILRSFIHVYLLLSFPNMRVSSLLSFNLFIVKSYFLALAKLVTSTLSLHANFIRKYKTSFKVKIFAWLVGNKKVEHQCLPQMRRPYKALSLDHCTMCLRSSESIDHLFLHCSVTLGM